MKRWDMFNGKMRSLNSVYDLSHHCTVVYRYSDRVIAKLPTTGKLEVV